MKKINSSLLAIMLMSVGFAAVAANAPDNKSLRHQMGGHPNVVYSVTQQTTTPNETLKKLVNDAPKAEDGKRYMVKMTIVEVPEFNKMNRNNAKQPTNTASTAVPAAQ
ncbi:hypothetical protein M2263_001234 [Providencia alcalifaciens]|nr:hypothetical protein [Providencia alcalifaciens]